MRNVHVKSVSKHYGDEIILNNLSIHIPGGQFFVLLGPSGCGKTTLLRLIAGLETADSGHIYLDDQDITHVPIYERKTNTVFQQYALFPHLTVFENVAYSLRVKQCPEKEIQERVREILNIVCMLGHENKKPQSLSGGQQQRICLARAIINKPSVLLLDEPLAALDLALKKKMLIELINLQEQLKTTFIYVTHDQYEALTVADQMAILNKNGIIEQIGTPKEIYEFPASKFVAQFVGTSNFIEGTLIKDNHEPKVQTESLGLFAIHIAAEKTWMVPGRHLTMSIRPEKIYITKKQVNGFSNSLTGVISEIIYSGQSTEYRVKIGNTQIITVFQQNEEHFPNETLDYDDQVYLYFQKENIVLLEY